MSMDPFPSVVCLVDKPSPEALELILGAPLLDDCNRLIGGNALISDYCRMRQHFCARKGLIRVVRSEFWDKYFENIKRQPDESLMYNIGFDDDDGETLRTIDWLRFAIFNFKKEVIVPPGFSVATPTDPERITEPAMRVAALEHLILDQSHVPELRKIVELREKFAIRDTLHIHVADAADFEGYPGVIVHKIG